MCRLAREADGRLRVDEWLGGAHTVANDTTDEECYRCLECAEELPAERDGNNHPTLLLRRIVEVLRGEALNPDALSAISDILGDGGFEFPHPGDEGID
jgi:hypothetical protein